MVVMMIVMVLTVIGLAVFFFSPLKIALPIYLLGVRDPEQRNRGPGAFHLL